MQIMMVIKEHLSVLFEDTTVKKGPSKTFQDSLVIFDCAAIKHLVSKKKEKIIKNSLNIY